MLLLPVVTLGSYQVKRNASMNLLDLPLFVVLHRLVKQLWVDLHEQLQCIIHHPMDRSDET